MRMHRRRLSGGRFFGILLRFMTNPHTPNPSTPSAAPSGAPDVKENLKKINKALRTVESKALLENSPEAKVIVTEIGSVRTYMFDLMNAQKPREKYNVTKHDQLMTVLEDAKEFIATKSLPDSERPAHIETVQDAQEHVAETKAHFEAPPVVTLVPDPPAAAAPAAAAHAHDEHKPTQAEIWLDGKGHVLDPRTWTARLFKEQKKEAGVGALVGTVVMGGFPFGTLIGAGTFAGISKVGKWMFGSKNSSGGGDAAHPAH